MPRIDEGLRKAVDMQGETFGSLKPVDTPEDVRGELEKMDGRPDTVPQHVWDLMRENGEIATRKLNELLRSPRFSRLKASDQAKLIALAQNRAYGSPKSGNAASNRRRAGTRDVVQAELDKLVYTASLPEYKTSESDDEEADVIDGSD